MADESEMTPAQRKLFELRMKVNAGRKANKQVCVCAVCVWIAVRTASLLRLDELLNCRLQRARVCVDLCPCVAVQEVAAEHERIVNKDKKTKKEESVKRKQVLCPRTWIVCVCCR